MKNHHQRPNRSIKSSALLSLGALVDDVPKLYVARIRYHLKNKTQTTADRYAIGQYTFN